MVREAESAAVEAELTSWERLVTSEVTAIELPRAVARARAENRADVADGRVVLELLASLGIVPLSDDVRALATQVGPVHLRTLDAIHLASALTLGTDLAGLLTQIRSP